MIGCRSRELWFHKEMESRDSYTLNMEPKRWVIEDLLQLLNKCIPPPPSTLPLLPRLGNSRDPATGEPNGSFTASALLRSASPGRVIGMASNLRVESNGCQGLLLATGSWCSSFSGPIVLETFGVCEVRLEALRFFCAPHDEMQEHACCHELNEVMNLPAVCLSMPVWIWKFQMMACF